MNTQLSTIISIIFAGILFLALLDTAYLYLLAFASLRKTCTSKSNNPPLRFAAVIPAHNEARVIGNTVETILAAGYPKHLLDVFVVADHCNDDTAELAREAGAVCFELDEGERSGKGRALSWLLMRIFEKKTGYQAVAVFDADTQVQPSFFNIMSARLSTGSQVVQGNYMIRNPQDGWFPALAWAMFLIDNRCQNLGRTNLGLSAKNMGDSICFQSGVLRWFGWGKGLTEDYALRQRLLLEGIHIDYEPAAVGKGYAPVNWHEASIQRARWLVGTYQASRKWARKMLISGIKSRDPALIDGALQALLPSYSTLTLMSGLITVMTWIFQDWLWSWLPFTWTMLLVLLFIYPLICLAFERAPLRAFTVILTGPVFILWRTWLGFSSRFIKQEVSWERTPRRVKSGE
jgi:cellulose synthase/poly-beta-1,6-N-acetylglucosamine synthase-like glycosyltransferase